jgi:hypothetical protein
MITLGVLFIIILALLGNFAFVLTGVFTGGGEWESRHNYYDINSEKRCRQLFHKPGVVELGKA